MNPDDEERVVVAMSLRDFFAGCALAGMFEALVTRKQRNGSEHTAGTIATEAYKAADAMMEAREYSTRSEAES